MTTPLPGSTIAGLIAGMPLYGSPYVAEDKVVVIDGGIYFHRRASVRTRYRRPHGRANGRRHRKTRVVIYQPGLDAMLAANAEAAPEVRPA